MNKDNKKNKKNINKKSISTKKTSKIDKKNSNIVEIKSSFSSQNFIHTKKLKTMLFIILIIFVLLIVRLGFIQFVEGNSLEEQAYRQQTINQIISPKRGNIYDSTGQALAISAQVDTITINPAKIKDKTEEKTKTLKEDIAKTFSDIFELNYEETLEKLNSTAQVETIAKKVDKEKVDKLKQWMSDNNVSVGINIDEDNKRYYPHATIASNVIGFCGNDNQGLMRNRKCVGISFKGHSWKDCKLSRR